MKNIYFSQTLTSKIDDRSVISRKLCKVINDIASGEIDGNYGHVT